MSATAPPGVLARDLIIAIRGIPGLADVQPVELTRIVPYLDSRSFAPNEVLCAAGEAAHSSYYILSGSADVHREGGVETVRDGLVGEEAAVGLDSYLADVVATTPVRAVVVPGEIFRRHQAGGVTGALYRSMAERVAPVRPPKVAATALSAPPADLSALAVVGWIATILVPAAILLTADSLGLDWAQRHVLASLVACLIMWAFNLVPQYAAATVAVVGCLVLGAVPTEVILSGFGDEDLFMVFGVFAVGMVLVRSGITDRVILTMLKYSPPTAWGYNATFLLAGLLLTPALPSANTRVELLTPLTVEASRSLGFKEGSRESTRLLISMFAGASIFAPIFLTSKSLNFIVYGMLPDQVSAEFHWLRWLSVTWPAALLMLVLYVAVTGFWFRGGVAPRLSRAHLDAQLDTLGPMRNAEWIALGSVTFFMLSLVTYPLHKISPFWVSFGVFLAFLLVGILEKKNLDRDFDWGVVLMVGFFIGLTQSLSHVGLTEVLSGSLAGVTQHLRSNFEISLLLLIAATSVARVFLPITTSGVVLCSLLVPLSIASGVNPWIVVFVTLMLNECWILPYQSSYYQTFEAMSGGPDRFDKALFLKANAMTVGIRIVTTFGALQYMRMMNLL